MLAALSDDAQAVVGEVSEAVGAALDEFHLAVEALGDAIVSGKSPHGDEGIAPVVEGLGQAHEGFEGALPQVFDQAQEAADVGPASLGRLMFEPQEIPELDHLFVERLQGVMGGQELLKLVLMPFLQSAGMALRHAKKAPMIFDLPNDLVWAKSRK